MIKRIIFSTFSVILFIYLILPGPDNITDFPPLPDSFKSKLSGDTVQIPNVSAYFSDNYRDFVIPFYTDSFASKTVFPFSPLVLNYPPEFAFTAIKDQTHSTYLQEIVYPLRDSIFINGWEPLERDGTKRYWGADKFGVEGKEYFTKVTLRYYPSSLLVRVLVWLGIISSVYFLAKVGRGILSNA